MASANLLVASCLAFLRLMRGNLTSFGLYRAHASNAYMLHALGITHVVSVGECALVPPQGNSTQAAEYRFSYGGKVLGAGPGSLWIEEREGRIKVLDIKVCHDFNHTEQCSTVHRAFPTMGSIACDHASAKCVTGSMRRDKRAVKSSSIAVSVFQGVPQLRYVLR